MLCQVLCIICHWSIQTGGTVRKPLIQVKVYEYLSCVTLEFDRWPWKTLWHLFYATSSFVHHFIAISKFILKLQSRNSQFKWKSAVFCRVWPWNLKNGLEKNRAALLCYFKLCVPFHSHRWIHSEVSLETLNSGENRRFFVAGDPEIWKLALKKIGHLLCIIS